MIINILLIIAGVAMVLYGADRLTDGASALARRMNVSEAVIGLTIVAAGTSAPELFVSLVSAVKGTPDMAVGNVVGSNIMNAMLIVGVAAMVAPMSISRRTVMRDIPWTVLASVLLIILMADNLLGRIDGLVLLAVFAVFMFFSLRDGTYGQTGEAQEETANAQEGTDDAQEGTDDAQEETGSRLMSPWMAVGYMIVGLALLVGGSNLFVESASDVALSLGISEGIVGLTIVAGGTSLPELATSVVAARKGRSAMAIGNVIGSNVFNILLILGFTATVSPLAIEGVTQADVAVVLLSVALVGLFARTRYTIEHWEGAVLTVGYLAYLAWLIANI